MAFFEDNFRWRGTILGAFKVPTTTLKMIWQPILEEILAKHGDVCFGISPNL